MSEHESTLILPRKEFVRLQQTASTDLRATPATLRDKNPFATLYLQKRDAELPVAQPNKNARRVNEAELQREEARAARAARDEAAAREWRLHFWARDGVKQLHSALKLAEVIRERETQKAFLMSRRKKTNEYLDEIQQQERESVRKAREQERQLKIALNLKKEQLRAALKAQIAENENKRLKEEAEVLKEREEILKEYREFCEETEKNKFMAESKQEAFVSEFMRTATEAREEKRLEAERDQLEQRLCDLVMESKHKNRDTMEAIRRQALETRMEKRQQQAQELYRACQKRVEVEQERAKKREAELTQRERDLTAKWILQEKERRKCALELREHQLRCAKEQRENMKKRISSAEKNERHNHTLVTKTFEEQQRQRRRKVQEENAKSYALQKEQQRLEIAAERSREEATALRQQIDFQMEDRQFLKYASCVLDESLQLGRPPRPLKKALQEYKKTFDIEKEPFVKESMRSHFKVGSAHPKHEKV